MISSRMQQHEGNYEGCYVKEPLIKDKFKDKKGATCCGAACARPSQASKEHFQSGGEEE